MLLQRGEEVRAGGVGGERRTAWVAGATRSGPAHKDRAMAGCRPSRKRVTVHEMKIYFGFTVAGDRSTLATARRIVEVLESMGHQVLTRHLVNDNAAQLDRSTTPQMVYERDMNWLLECDLFIAEASGSSFGLGYEAGFLLGSSSRRAVLFYREDAADRISLLITGNTHPNCTLAPYSGFDEIEAVLRSATAP